MIMRIVGLDLSLTATGIGVYDTGSKPLWSATTVKTTPREEHHVRLQVILAQIAAQTAGARRADLVVIEGPSFASTGGRAHERGGLWWLVAHQLWNACRPYKVCPPTTLKLFATGSGNARKAAMVAAARAAFPVTPANDNEADALWLAAVGRVIHAQRLFPDFDGSPMSEKQLNALKKVV